MLMPLKYAYRNSETWEEELVVMAKMKVGHMGQIDRYERSFPYEPASRTSLFGPQATAATFWRWATTKIGIHQDCIGPPEEDQFNRIVVRFGHVWKQYNHSSQLVSCVQDAHDALEVQDMGDVRTHCY